MRISSDDVLIGADAKYDNIENTSYVNLRKEKIGLKWFKNDPYKLFHEMQY